MSSTGRKKKDGSTTERRASDFYATPRAPIQSLLDNTPELVLAMHDRVILEPCAGTGNIIRAIDEIVHPDIKKNFVAIELEGEFRKHLTDLKAYLYCPQDYLEWQPIVATCFEQYNNLIGITNPPFSIWKPIAEKMLKECQIVALLLRLGVLGSKKRNQFWQDHNPWINVLSDRPSFTEDGKTDSDYYAWFIWGLGHEGEWRVI